MRRLLFVKWVEHYDLFLLYYSKVIYFLFPVLVRCLYEKALYLVTHAVNEMCGFPYSVCYRLALQM